MVKLFTNGREDRDSIPGRVISKTQKWYLMPLGLIFSIIRYGSRVSGAIQGNELRPPLHLGVVVIEKGAFGTPSTMVDQLTTYNNNQEVDTQRSTSVSNDGSTRSSFFNPIHWININKRANDQTLFLLSSRIKSELLNNITT